MRVKICGIKNEKELDIAVNAGADAIGFMVGQRHPSKDFILPATAARLASRLPPFVSPVLVTHLTEPEAIIELIEQTFITTVQLHGGSQPEQITPLLEYLEIAGKLILAIHVTAPGEFSPDPSLYYEKVHAILLDSMDPATGRVGGTGRTHDWNTSAKLAAASPRPVILAGGLNPDNVADAIRVVRPFAVDVNSSLKRFDGELDPKACAAFVRNAKNAFDNSPS